MDDNKKMELLVKIAKKVFGSGPGVLTGHNGAAFGVKGKDVEIGVIEMPKVIVAGIALGIGIEPSVIGEASALDLGESSQQIAKNLSVLKKKYDLAAKEIMGAKPHYSFKVYTLKHNQIARRLNEALGNKVTPDFPYQFVREREIGEK